MKALPLLHGRDPLITAEQHEILLILRHADILPVYHLRHLRTRTLPQNTSFSQEAHIQTRAEPVLLRFCSLQLFQIFNQFLETHTKSATVPALKITPHDLSVAACFQARPVMTPSALKTTLLFMRCILHQRASLREDQCFLNHTMHSECPGLTL